MPSSPRRSALRAGTVLTVATAAALIGAVPAFAHVTAQPGEAEQGGYSVVNMRVPNESDTAGTIKLEVRLPADHPITSVRTTPVAGWTAQMVKAPLATPIQSHGRTITEAVSTVTWTANPGTRIGPGEYLEFPLSLGPLPSDVTKLELPAIQTYDDGEVVAWDQPSPADGSEPERPAPVLTLTPATGEGGHHAPSATEQSASAATDTTARWLGGAGLLVGALGVGVGGGAVLRSRKSNAGSGG
ncbi:YcnI family copper-binding membrane protein [Pseudonocardia sp. TRM90224]|uniref:YcnI family copper-binding membrane protein n=1 Tax=Pseudonocardia sp. TRM90224 TaxID=2812678 RepID=UPI001E442E6D|nr:YcnI family protein [Pseudonocardia sp. TRM90224]